MARSFASRIGILAGVELQLGADHCRVVCSDRSRMQAWTQRTTNGLDKTTVRNSHSDLVQPRADLLICMLIKLTTNRLTNTGTHNKRW